MDSGFRAVDSGFQLLDSRSFPVELGFRIPIVSGIPDSYSCIPDFKPQDSGFHWQKFPGFRNPDSLTCIKGSKTVWDSGFRIPVTGFQIFFSGTWTPHCKCQWDSRFLQLYFGFPGTGARIPKAKISSIPESVFPYIGRNPYE